MNECKILSGLEGITIDTELTRACKVIDRNKEAVRRGVHPDELLLGGSILCRKIEEVPLCDEGNFVAPVENIAWFTKVKQAIQSWFAGNHLNKEPLSS